MKSRPSRRRVGWWRGGVVGWGGWERKGEGKEGNESSGCGGLGEQE